MELRVTAADFIARPSPVHLPYQRCPGTPVATRWEQVSPLGSETEHEGGPEDAEEPISCKMPS